VTRALRIPETTWGDVRTAVRGFGRAPGVAIVATATLALAIGATTAIFSLLNALALRDLPVRDPDSLVHVAMTTRIQETSPLTFRLFGELSARQQVFSAVIGTWGNSVVTVREQGRTTKALLWAGTGNVHEELGVRPAIGRLLVARDMTMSPPSGEPVAVLGYSFWQRQFQGDTSIVGRTIRVEDVPFTVVGVAPAGFTGFAVVTEPDVTIPLAAIARIHRSTSFVTSDARNIQVIGRLRDGTTLEQARAALDAVWPGVREAAVPTTFNAARRADFLSMGLSVTSAARGVDSLLRPQYTRPLAILLGIAGLVLFIACTNVAGLLLSHTSTRRHEIAMRLALGATSYRVARLMVTEGLLLSIAGAAAGVVLSYWACAAIVRIVLADFTVPVVFDAGPDLRVIAITTAVAVAAGVLCSGLPAWRGTRELPGAELRAEGRTVSSRGYAGRLVVATQLALSVVLLTAAGVLVRSLVEMRMLDTGIDRTAEVFVAYPEAAQPGAYEKVDNDSYYPDVLSRLEAVSGVRRASVSLLKPGAGGGFRETVVRAGDAVEARDEVVATRSPVAPGFLEAVGVRLLKGRDFDWRDNSKGRGATILSESLARRLFGDADPIGQRVSIGLNPAQRGIEIVGVAADARLYDLKDPDVLAAYTPALQDRNASFKCFVIRGDNIAVSALRAAVEGFGRERFGNVVTLRYITDRALLIERLTAMMSGFFASLVVLLAGVGLFGLMSHTVSQRRKEIGIRMAVGAARRQIVWEVVRDGLAVTLGGLSIGAFAALGTVQVVRTLLFGVTPQDPLALATAFASLILTAIAASAVPAWRASQVDPLVSLRGD
jgi:putative ABC transport system permease protein